METGTAWEGIEGMSVYEKLHLAIQSSLKKHPDAILIDRLGIGMDWEHLQRVKKEMQTLLRRGISLLLLNPAPQLAETCCDQKVFLTGGQVNVL